MAAKTPAVPATPAVAVGTPLHRRTLLKGAGTGAALLLSALVAPDGVVDAAPTAARQFGYAFNVATKDVTIFDVATRRVLTTRPLGAQVRLLSNANEFWDGRYMWTYDFPSNMVQAIAIDPRAISVARTIPAGGRGPAHSLMLTPDRKQAWVNVATDDFVAVLDVATGETIEQIKMGKFP